jgi:hypothetical protein
MYEYGMVKSIHDQRMRQFMIEAERNHLLRMLARIRREEQSALRRPLDALAVALGVKLRSRPQPAM